MMLRARSRPSRAASRGRLRTRECACGVVIRYRYLANRAGSGASCPDCLVRYVVYDRPSGTGTIPANLKHYGETE